MLDELLGRTPLKERIAELEEENERLRRRYDAESDRRAEAVRERQEAQERQNRLEDRIAQLEGELDRVTDDRHDLEFRRRDRIRGSQLREVLDRLDSFRTGPEGALTAPLDMGVPDDAVDLLGPRAGLLEELDDGICCLDDEGVLSVALDPPVSPSIDATWSDGFRLEREWFLPTGSFTLALVRADLFALGTYRGEEQRSSRGFKSDVKSDHSKGGFSQARFERIRDEQIDDHLERCQDALSEADPDRLFLVGQRGVVDELAPEVTPVATAAVDATGEPQSALEDAFRSFWTTTLYVV